MRKLFVILICFVVCGLMSVNAQSLKEGATCPVTKAMVNYEGQENINISFIPRSLFVILENNGFPEDLLGELKKLDRLNMMFFNKEHGDMGVYDKIIKEFDAVFTNNNFVQLKNTSENGATLRLFVKMEKEKPVGMTMVYDAVNMLDIVEFEGAFNVAKIPAIVKSIAVFEKLGKKL